jgi:hypothetical protein
VPVFEQESERESRLAGARASREDDSSFTPDDRRRVDVIELGRAQHHSVEKLGVEGADGRSAVVLPPLVTAVDADAPL